MDGLTFSWIPNEAAFVLPKLVLLVVSCDHIVEVVSQDSSDINYSLLQVPRAGL